MTAACKTITPGGLICGDPAPIVVAAGCVHEHIETDPICDWHLQRMQEGDLRRPDCWRSPDQHHCVMLGRVVVP